MNRRNFLKRCSILSFVGGLFAVAKTGVSEGQRRRVPTKAELLDVLAEGLRKKYDRQAQVECERLAGIYYEHYDIETKTMTQIENGEVIESRKFKSCPYLWWNDELNKKIESGEIKFVMWKKHRASFSLDN